MIARYALLRFRHDDSESVAVVRAGDNGRGSLKLHTDFVLSTCSESFLRPPNFLWVSGANCWSVTRYASIWPPEPTPIARIIAAFPTARKSFQGNDSRHLHGC